MNVKFLVTVILARRLMCWVETFDWSRKTMFAFGTGDNQHV